MRLKEVWISEYKNLKDFTVKFDGESFVDIFVGKNGSGKSNFFEALLTIFRDIKYRVGKKHNPAVPPFQYKIVYEINGQVFVTTNKVIEPMLQVPEHILMYYSGHNQQVPNSIADSEQLFIRDLKESSLADIPYVVGLTEEYKKLLFFIFCIKKTDSKAQQYIFEKFNISGFEQERLIVLRRPNFAKGRLAELGVTNIDHFDTKTHFWGALGITRDFINKLLQCIKSEYQHQTIYFQDDDSYHLPINIELFNRVFADESLFSLFANFNNLRLLGMLGNNDFYTDVKITGTGNNSHVLSFSDGQFQIMFIYALCEVFKDKNCLILLDEPDSFLHPEWQFDFLEQINKISKESSKNHVLMTSHSAITQIPFCKEKIQYFDLKEHHAALLPENWTT